jgi:hypothetical protein
MDSERFDGLARTFSHARSRRQALRSLAGLSAGAFAVGGQAVSAQDCKGVGKACKKNSQCCSENCVGGGGSGSTSQSEGVCVGCPSGHDEVNGGCFEITDSGQNCNAGCTAGYGNVDGSGNFLCGERQSGTNCTDNAGCPDGQACTTCCGAGFCIAPC